MLQVLLKYVDENPSVFSQKSAHLMSETLQSMLSFARESVLRVEPEAIRGIFFPFFL